MFNSVNKNCKKIRNVQLKVHDFYNYSEKNRIVNNNSVHADQKNTQQILLHRELIENVQADQQTPDQLKMYTFYSYIDKC